MKNRHISIEVITGDVGINCYKTELISGIVIHRVPTWVTPFGIFLKRRSDKKMIKKHLKDADIIHINDIRILPIYHLCIGINKSAKHFLSSHGFIFHTKKHLVLKKIFMYWFSKISQRYSGIFCVSKQDFRIALEYKLANCFYVSMGITSTNIEKFYLTKTSVSIEGRLFYYGRIDSNKGLENAFRKISLLPKEFIFIIAGTGDLFYIKKLNQICNELGITERVFFIGSISDDELINQLGMAEFVILSSLYEGFGLALIESLAAHKKIIAQNNESYNDILSNLKLTNYLFDFIDTTSSLLDKIIYLRKLPFKESDLSIYLLESTFNTIYNFYNGLAP